MVTVTSHDSQENFFFKKRTRNTKTVSSLNEV